MVKPPHEALHQIFRHDPRLFADFLDRAAGLCFPKVLAVHEINPNLNEIRTVESEADTVLMVETVDGSHIVVIEAQERVARDKLKAWPYYVAYLRNKYDCEVTLIVVCHEVGTAEWARRAIFTGLAERPSQCTWPIVLAPDNVSPLTSAAEFVRDPMSAAFRVLTHASGEPTPGIIEALEEGLAALKQQDLETAQFLGSFLHAGLAKSSLLEPWRQIVSTIIKDKRLFEEIRADAEQEMLLTALAARGFELTDADRERIATCTDTATLKRWLVRTFEADSVGQVFSEG
ncbi:hypothetical protein DZF91_00660 [Actinomadura logoneensis]|uniref:Rpn family recombination-promoting nuclease/putative transposase n=1 Tax=Actinomadura logoneensis TaxID=2293572 RepID=A0A372JU96_9ACTN|nr:hypothetical protein [Actinomadura logoneensis]RFU43540.1 hypothetical protein DZF91_00660 [Actinomadura logoneensis]